MMRTHTKLSQWMIVGIGCVLCLTSAFAQEADPGDFDDTICDLQPGSLRDFSCREFGTVGSVTAASEALTRSSVMQTLLERIRDPEMDTGGASADLGGERGFFVTGLFGFHDQDQTSRETASDTDRYGLIMGLDWRRGPLVAGMALDYTYSDTTFEDQLQSDLRIGKRKSDEYGIQGFGLYYLKPQAWISGLARYGYTDYRTQRRVRFVDDDDIRRDEPVGGTTRGRTIGIVGSAGYDWALDRGVELSLSGSIDYQRTRIDGYTEDALPNEPVEGGRVRFDDDEVETLTTILELRLARAYSVPTGVIVPHLAGRYLHEFENKSRKIRFAAIGDNGVTISGDEYQTNNPDKDYLNLEIGVSSAFVGGWAAFAAYDVLLAHSFRSEHNLNIGLRREF